MMNNNSKRIQVVKPIHLLACENLFYIILLIYGYMFYDVPQEEHPGKKCWWINELESLGVDTEEIIMN